MRATAHQVVGRIGIGAAALIGCALVLGQQFAVESFADRARPLGLPPLPDSQRVRDEALVALGRRLFFERGLSFNNTLSCGMCHLESNAFASTQSSKAVGMEGQTLRRNAPSVLNVVYQKSLLHDGREHDLALQVWLPLLAADEMANPSIGHVLRRLQALDGYSEAFSKVYPDRGIAVDTIGDAIAAYESTLLSANSRFDRWLFGRDKGALTTAEQEGLALFTGKAGCASCHRIELDHALFTDHEFHNTGIGYRATMQRDRQYSVQLAPGESTVVRDAELRSVAEGVKGDIGRFEITLKSEHRWAYKTPSLRNVTLTPPYMHDGSIATLAEVVRYYNDGGVANDGLDPRIRKLGLTPQEQDNLLAFLGTLVGE